VDAGNGKVLTSQQIPFGQGGMMALTSLSDESTVDG